MVMQEATMVARFGQARGWIRGNWRKAVIFAVVMVSTVLAYALGRHTSPEAVAVLPQPAPVQNAAQQATVSKSAATETSNSSIVATVYGAVITRQDFSEYLIAREAKRLDQFVNKRIIEHYCQERGVSVSDAEIDAAILNDLGPMRMEAKQFLDQILKKNNMSFYEWREDVIRPQLMLKKIVTNMVRVEAEDLQKAYEAEFGEKRECRIIMWPESMRQHVLSEIYCKIRDNDDEFERAARTQANPSLAACGGRLNKPISRYSLADRTIEDCVFHLKQGEMTEVLQQGPDLVVFKCDNVVPRVENPPALTTVRDKYEEIIKEVKIRDEMPKLFEKLHEEAKVTTYLETPEAEKERWLRAKQLAGIDLKENRTEK
jgi:hypothetical protein